MAISDKIKKNVSWTFLTNHAHVILCLASNPDMVLREVANQVGITERAVQRIVHELEEAGAIKKKKNGRQNHYSINRRFKLRHPIEQHRKVGDLIKFVEH